MEQGRSIILAMWHNTLGRKTAVSYNLFLKLIIMKYLSKAEAEALVASDQFVGTRMECKTHNPDVTPKRLDDHDEDYHGIDSMVTEDGDYYWYKTLRV